MNKIRRTITINDTNRDFVLSVFDDYDQQTADKIIEKISKMTPDEIFKKTKWVLNVGDVTLAFVSQYQHGVLDIDNVRVIVSIIDGKKSNLAGKGVYAVCLKDR